MEIAVWLLRLQSDCWDCCLIAEIAVWNGVLGAWHTLECGHLGVRHGKIYHWLWRLQSPTRRWMTNCICKLPNLCNLSNQTAISAIRLQSQQSDCNLILKSVDCIWITQRERFNPWEMFWKYWHMAFIRLLGLLGFDCFRITWRMHQIALDHWDCT